MPLSIVIWQDETYHVSVKNSNDPQRPIQISAGAKVDLTWVNLTVEQAKALAAALRASAREKRGWPWRNTNCRRWSGATGR